MKIIWSIFYIALVTLSASTHLYFVWKNQQRKTMWLQLMILAVAMGAGILIIYKIQDYTIAGLLNNLSPLEK